MIQRLFVYGTLAPGQPNSHLLEEIGGSWENASVIGTLHPEGWGAAIGYPAIILSDDGEKVTGFLFSSNKLSDHWAKLDDFEGKAYERVTVVVTLGDNSKVDANVYVLRIK